MSQSAEKCWTRQLTTWPWAENASKSASSLPTRVAIWSAAFLLEVLLISSLPCTNYCIPASVLPVKLLTKSASMCGFFLMHYPQMMPSAFKNLAQLMQEGKLNSKVDFGPADGIKGLENIADGVDYLYSKQSIGKIVVRL